MIDVVDLAAAVLEAVQDLDHGEDVLAAQRALGVGHAREVQAHVHLHATDRREVVAVDVEQQALPNRVSACSSVGGSPGRMTR